MTGGLGLTAVIIILAILLVLLGLLLLPVTWNAHFDTQLHLSVRYICFRYTIAPPKQKKKKKDTPPAKEHKGEDDTGKDANVIKEIIRQTGLSGFLCLLKETAKAAGSVLKGLLRHTVLSCLDIDICVGGEDAADTAVTYGYICAAVYPAAGVITSAVKKYKKLRIDIHPDYDRRQTQIICRAQARISLLFLLGNLIKGAYKLFKQFIKAKRQGII